MRFDVRMSGLGGQGMVTAAHVLGSAAVKDGNYGIVVPFFGAEKRLAPTESYVRISTEPVYEKGEVTYPNVIMVFHEEVITKGKCYTMPFYDGLRPDGRLIINTDNVESVLSEKHIRDLEKLNVGIFYLPATKVALEVAGTELATNMAMLGALIGVTNIVTFDSLEESIAERFGRRRFVASATTAALDDVLKKRYAKLQELVRKNMEAVRIASELVEEW